MNLFKDSDMLIEKYRPETLDEIVLAKPIKTFIQNCIEAKNIPNMIFYGHAGTGKTTLVGIIARALGTDYLYLNGSQPAASLREEIKRFVSTFNLSESGCKFKIVFIDEAEKIHVNIQDALKVDMEELSENARFIFNTNNITKIIDPLQSRFSQGVFNLIPSDRTERQALAVDFMKRLDFILKNEKLEYDQAVIGQLIVQKFPDFRRIIGNIDKFRTLYKGEKIDERVLGFGKGITDELLDSLIKKDVKNLRKIATDTDANTFFKEFDTNMYDIIVDDPENIINATFILGKFVYEHGISTDEVITLKSCFLALAGKIKFKSKDGK
jgi:DNA polymerase III delta prime subunit